MSATTVEAPSNEHDVAIAEAEAAAVAAVAETARTAAEAQADAAVDVAEAQASDLGGELAQCRAELQTVIRSQEESSREVMSLRAEMAAMHERISSMQSKPETEPEPEPNPNPEQSGEVVEVVEEPPAAEEAKEPEPVERKRAHRWI
jgi:chromosome segregation ATPase